MQVEDEDVKVEETVKERNCLMCGQEFKSSWAGERICPRCKSSQAWRTGRAR